MLSEPECHKVMDVLRQTNTEASKITLKQRMLQKKKEKNEKKFTNKNMFKKAFELKKHRNSLRHKIKIMRKEKIFPLPMGPTNYRKQFGIIPKIIIK